MRFFNDRQGPQFAPQPMASAFLSTFVPVKQRAPGPGANAAYSCCRSCPTREDNALAVGTAHQRDTHRRRFSKVCAAECIIRGRIFCPENRISRWFLGWTDSATASRSAHHMRMVQKLGARSWRPGGKEASEHASRGYFPAIRTKGLDADLDLRVVWPVSSLSAQLARIVAQLFVLS
ncbi:hypothetical protein BDW74DRAFT_120908 [Aspergillus multicolor]|uniref:uncharacterized protein n=1 Tax=Aspergillus multicolor TaxID=41759 RepID=UPI003CCD805E